MPRRLCFGREDADEVPSDPPPLVTTLALLVFFLLMGTSSMPGFDAAIGALAMTLGGRKMAG
jgi:hypothetical protein